MNALNLTVAIDFDEPITEAQAEAIRANIAHAIHRARLDGAVTPDDMEAMIEEVTVNRACHLSPVTCHLSRIL